VRAYVRNRPLNSACCCRFLGGVRADFFSPCPQVYRFVGKSFLGTSRQCTTIIAGLCVHNRHYRRYRHVYNGFMRIYNIITLRLIVCDESYRVYIYIAKPCDDVRRYMICASRFATESRERLRSTVIYGFFDFIVEKRSDSNVSQKTA